MILYEIFNIALILLPQMTFLLRGGREEKIMAIKIKCCTCLIPFIIK